MIWQCNIPQLAQASMGETFPFLPFLPFHSLGGKMWRFVLLDMVCLNKTQILHSVFICLLHSIPTFWKNKVCKV